MEQLRDYNKKLLHNILPSHVAGHFLATEKKNEVIISKSISMVYGNGLKLRKERFLFYCIEWD